MKKFAAVVLSAGTGKRMKSDIPKQYMMLQGKPVIYYSLSAFEQSMVSEIVLVVSEEDKEFCKKEIVEKYQFQKVTAIVSGGKERYHSVAAGLDAIWDADYVLIHDGARPMLTQDIITRSMQCVMDEDACVVGMPVKDTIKICNAAQYATQTPNRESLWQIQTPQTFSYSLIQTAYHELLEQMQQGNNTPVVTDDAMVVEYIKGKKIKLIEGSYENIKITTPEDLLIAELFLKK